MPYPKAPLLSIQDLHVTFDTFAGTTHAVRGVSFDLYRGETIAIVGESGCGKSVTAQTILQLIPQPPGHIRGGSIFFEGKDLLKLNEQQMRQIRGRDIGMIFQDPMTSLNPTLSIGYQIQEVILEHRPMSRDQAIRESIELLKLVGIPDATSRITQYPHEFSGGMRQRVMIAIGLACHPKLLIADEPTTALDVTIQAQILDLMRRIQKQTHTSIILITHDLGVVAGMADRVIVMYGGQVVESGSVEQIFYQTSHPYTKALLSALPKGNGPRQAKLTPIEGSPPDLLHPLEGCSFSPRCNYAMRLCQDFCPSLLKAQEGQSSRCFLHLPQAKSMKNKFDQIG